MAALTRLFSNASPLNLSAKILSVGIQNVLFQPACATGVLINSVQIRKYEKHKRRRTHPPVTWAAKRAQFVEQYLTNENRAFIKEVIEDKYDALKNESPLKESPWPKGEWTPKTQRTGVIAKKIGIYPMWEKDGTRILTTLLQVVDNHVIRYVPPDVYRAKYKFAERHKGRFGLLVVGAEDADPQKFTGEYLGLFNDSGTMPKEKLCKFLVTPNAAIQPGTPLFATHFKVGDYVDVYGKTIDHGYQGVVKRWGFKGGPASHGCTKFHRRPGSIGTGRQMARVWPGKKMPGHMGSERRTLNGQKIVRINTKYNIIFIKGPAVPGGAHSYVKIFDTYLPLRRHKTPPHFPTYYPADNEPLPDDLYDPKIHPFDDPTLLYENEPEIVMPEPPKSKSRKLRR